MIDGTTGLLQHRVVLPLQLTNAYDALVTDNTDNLVFAITLTGIAQVNLTSLPVGSQVRRFSRAKNRSQFRLPQSRIAASEWMKHKNWLSRPQLRYEGTPNRPGFGPHD